MTLICKECNKEFEEGDDGFYYCPRCYVQAEDIIRTDEDFAGEGGHHWKNTRRRSSNLVTEKLRYEDYYNETRDKYVNGFVKMINYQCDALVKKFNVTPLIIGLVAPICLRYIAISGVYDDTWDEMAILDSELQGDARKGKKCERNKAETKNLDGKRAVMIWISQLRKSLPLSTTLAISFLACHLARAPVLPTDIVRWAREGKIPFMSCFLQIKPQMRARPAACPVKASVMFKPFGIVSAQVLESRAAKVADVIGLPLPPVDFYGIASKYLKRLSIPEDKVFALVRLLQNWSMSPDLYLSKNELRLPTRVCVMSIIIVAVRMLYNINGFGVWERSLELVNASVADIYYEEPDEEVLEQKSAAAETEFDTEELLRKLEARYYEVTADTLEYEKDLLSHLSHGKDELFAGLKEASTDNTYRIVDNLWNDYQKNMEFDRNVTPSKRVRDWEVDLPLKQLSLDNTKSSEENNPCSNSPSRSSKSGSMDHDQCSSEHRDSAPENHNQEDKSKEKALERLIADMRENLFRYIPPRVKLKRLDYLHYVRKKENEALIYAAHADYYVLLRVCAQVAEIDVRNMHRGVLSLERRLAWIENRIDQVLHLPPLIMTSDDGNVAEDQDDDLIL